MLWPSPVKRRKAKRSALRRGMAVVGKVFAIAGLVATLVLTLALLLVNTRLGRNAIKEQTTAALTPVFRGKWSVLEIGWVGFGAVGGVDAVFRDETGRTVLRVQDVEARIAVLSTVTSLLIGESDIELIFTHARIGHAEVLLDVDQDGLPFLARAFEPAPSADQEPEQEVVPPTNEASRGVHLQIPRADIQHAWVHGQLDALPRLDVELQEVRGAVEVTAAAVTVKVLQVTLLERALWQGAQLKGKAAVSLDIPFGDQNPIRLGTSFLGALGALPLASVATLKGNELYAAAALGRASEQGMRDLLPSFPIHAPVSAGMEAKGTLPVLKLDGYLEAGVSRVAVVGSVNVDDPIAAKLDIKIRDLDLRALGPSLPQSQFDAEVAAQIQVDQRINGTATMAIAAGQVASVQVPPIQAQAAFSNETVTLNGSLSDGSSSATFRIDGRSEGNEYVMGIDVSASSGDLSRYTEIVPDLSGKLQLNGEGELRLGEQSNADVTVWVRADDLHVAGAELATGTACARLLGALEDPELTLDLNAEQLVYQNQHVTQAVVRARGSLSKMDVKLSLEGEEDRPSLYANTMLELKPGGVDIIEPHLILWRKQRALDLRAERVRVGKAGISVKHGIVEGPGNRLQFDGQMGEASLSFKAQGRGLRLHDLAYVLGRDARTEGIIDVDVDLVASPNRTLGRLDLSLQQADIEKVGKGSMRANLVLEERRVAGTIVGDIGPYYVRLQADDVRLAGPMRKARSWRDAIGRVSLDADIDLGRLKAVLPERSIPFDVMTGSLEASGKIERAQAGAPPQLDARLKTRGFQISKKGDEQPRFDGKVVQGPPKWKLEGVDFEIATRISGSNGMTDFNGRALDRHGTIVALTFDAEVPYRAWAANPKTALRGLSELPIHAKITVPRRKMDTLPPPLRIKGMAGDAEVQLDFKQEQGVPTLELFVGVQRLQFQERADGIPITAQARGQYQGDRGKLEVKLACADRPTLTGSSEITGDLSQLIRGEVSTMNWRAVNRVDAARFPLQAIPVLAERRVEGSLSGNAAFEIANDAKPEFDGEFKFDKLKIADVRYTSGHLTARLDKDSLRAAIELKQLDGGLLTVAARMEQTPHTGAPRKNGESRPTFDAATIDAKVTRFRASALQPFLQGTVAQLDGLLDGKMNLVLSDRSALGGNLQLRQGTLQLETFGEELHGVEAKVLFQPNGVIVLESARARGVSGKVEATGRAKMKGLSLVEAHATVNIPKRKPLPVVIEGESMAEAWANLDLDIARQGNSTHATVSVRKAGIRIPDKSAHDLQTLGPPSAIRVGVQRSPTQFVILPEVDDEVAEPAAEAEPVRISLNLNNVEVRRGTTLRTRLDGQLTVAAGRNNDVRGQIRLSKGSLDVEGKRFEIERGVITFVGDPSNPQVVLTAGWTAPEGTRVYADFTGPLRTGKVVLRAEPARTQSEILSLILFGTTDGQAVPVSSSQQSSDPGASGAALGVGGGIATQGINRALDDMTGLDITTRVDTADSSNPKPEVEVQIAQDIALSIAHVLGTPSAAEGLDRNFLTLDWRFLRNWSLETTFGDRGSVVMDAVWQLRY